MRANPGGIAAVENIVGRDEFIGELWRVLESRSLVLTAERRMGKTSILKKMEAEKKSDEKIIPVYRDLEGRRKAIEFAELVYKDVEAYLSRRGRQTKKARGLLSELGGAELGKFIKFPATAAAHWKDILNSTLEDLSLGLEEAGHSIVLFWDEMPMMLADIKRDEGETVSMEILDTLRAARQTYPSIRMVFTGSIGLHHVLHSLKRAGHLNAATNDMHIQEVPPLSEKDAEKLVGMLFDGEGLDGEDGVKAAIARSVDCIPYYIHHVVDRLVRERGIILMSRVEELVGECLESAHDVWHMEHYRNRIDLYYAPDEREQEDMRPIILGILDILATSEGALSLEDLFQRLQSENALWSTSKEFVRDILKLMLRDHYISREGGQYQFRFPLIQKWWLRDRGLVS